MRTFQYIISMLMVATILVSCDEIGLVEKKRLDSANREISQLKVDLEQSTQTIRALEQEKDRLKNRLDEVEEENEEYLGILRTACEKSERLEKIINNEDHVSFGDLEQAVTELRESLGYKQVYYNYSYQPFQSQQTTVTKQPDYLFK